MVISKTDIGKNMQLIPISDDERSFTAPPTALQTQTTPTELFYVRNHWVGAPEIDIDTYRLVVDGEVESPLSLSYEDIQQMAAERFQALFECCGNGIVPEAWARQSQAVVEQTAGYGFMGNAEWAGVTLSQILKKAGVKGNAVEVIFSGADHGPDEVAGGPTDLAYERSLPIAKAMHPDTLLAYEMNGEVLTSLHGYPLRLVVPGWYGMCSVKWLVRIHVTETPFEGFYQTQRYMVTNGPGADTFYTYLTEMKVKSLITTPAFGEKVKTGNYIVCGAAWSGEREVIRIDVSTDGGTTWTEARLLPKSGYSWYRWEYEWSIPRSGNYVLMAKATNDKGETQPMDFPNKWDGRGYGNNMVFPYAVEVCD